MSGTDDKVIALCTKARRALAAARSVEDFKAVKDVGEAAVRLAKSRRDGGLQAVLEGQEIVRRAERQLGEMLPDLTGGSGRKKNSQDASFLSELGIKFDQSSRFQKVAKIPQEMFEDWIVSCRAKGEEMTQAAALRIAAEWEEASKPEPETVDEYESGAVSSLQELISRGCKYGCIYADPPWAYSNTATRSNVDGEYKSTMTVDEICLEPVSELAADDCHLHLWTTNAFLFDAKRVMESWGFEYKSCFVWVKPQMGIGNYWRVSHEFMLLGIRGRPEFRRRDCKSWGSFDRTEHSRKPGDIRRLVESVSHGPYLEMYGRQLSHNWMVYGNEVSAQSLLKMANC